MKLKGTVRRSAIEGGLWVFEAEGGKRYQLAGAPDDVLKDGATLEIEGDIDRTAVSFGMSGPIFKVSKATARE